MLEITTQLTEEIFKDYYSFTLYRINNPRLIRAFFILLPIFSASILIMTILQQASFWLGYAVGGLGLALFAGHAYMLGPGMKSQYQSLPESLKIPQKLIFEEESITARCELEGELQESIYSYKKVAVQETENAVYIFVAEGQALILSKTQLTEDIRGIVTLLKEKVPEAQYMLCYKPSRKKEK